MMTTLGGQLPFVYSQPQSAMLDYVQTIPEDEGNQSPIGEVLSNHILHEGPPEVKPSPKKKSKFEEQEEEKGDPLLEKESSDQQQFDPLAYLLNVSPLIQKKAILPTNSFLS